MAIKAIGENIIVEKDPRTETMGKGIVIPAASLRTPRFGPTVLATVISVGGRCQTLQPGNRVAVKDVAGDDIFWEGKIFTQMRERDIVGLANE